MTMIRSTGRQDALLLAGLRSHRVQHPALLKIEGGSDNSQSARDSSTNLNPIIGPAAGAVMFGPFRLLPAQRLLLEAGQPVHLGSRALEVLIALVERHGELVSRNELLARVWPDTIVGEANLSVQVAALRRALRDGRDGNRYLISIPGRGYRFVASVAPETMPQQAAPSIAATRHHHNLPASLTGLFGRTECIDRLAGQLAHRRLLTIAGPAGVGKSSVALSLAERLIDGYEHGVWQVDLAALRDPLLVPTMLAASLRLELRAADPVADLITTIKDRRMLLVLDNCEHLIATVAALADVILRAAPGLHILATSREPLRVKGEQVYRLPALEIPGASTGLSAAAALAYPVVQLFVERAVARFAEFRLSDADAPIVAQICGRLDGIPLAVELAAARVEALGVRGVAARLDDCLRLLTVGSRSVDPRHRTMRAALDWSHGLLAATEQMVLRRLAIFGGEFTLGDAVKAAADAVHHESEIVDTVLELVAKSLISVDVRGAESRFRLLRTTRAYALEQLAAGDGGEALERADLALRQDVCDLAA